MRTKRSSRTVKRSIMSEKIRPCQSAAFPEIRALYADDCQQCGMCCIYFAGKFRINVDDDGVQPPKKLVQIGPRINYPSGGGCNRWMRVMPDPFWAKGGFKRCVALKGQQGHKVECGVYEDRPSSCRSFDPGSDYCLQVREWAGRAPIPEQYGQS